MPSTTAATSQLCLLQQPAAGVSLGLLTLTIAHRDQQQHPRPLAAALGGEWAKTAAPQQQRAGTRGGGGDCEGLGAAASTAPATTAAATDAFMPPQNTEWAGGLATMALPSSSSPATAAAILGGAEGVDTGMSLDFDDSSSIVHLLLQQQQQQQQQRQQQQRQQYQSEKRPGYGGMINSGGGGGGGAIAPMPPGLSMQISSASSYSASSSTATAGGAGSRSPPMLHAPQPTLATTPILTTEMGTPVAPPAPPRAEALDVMARLCLERVLGRPDGTARRTELGIALRDALGPAYQKGWVNHALAELERREQGRLTLDGVFFRAASPLLHSLADLRRRSAEAAGANTAGAGVGAVAIAGGAAAAGGLPQQQPQRRRGFLVIDGGYYEWLQWHVLQGRVSERLSI